MLIAGAPAHLGYIYIRLRISDLEHPAHTILATKAGEMLSRACAHSSIRQHPLVFSLFISQPFREPTIRVSRADTTINNVSANEKGRLKCLQIGSESDGANDNMLHVTAPARTRPRDAAKSCLPALPALPAHLTAQLHVRKCICGPKCALCANPTQECYRGQQPEQAVFELNRGTGRYYVCAFCFFSFELRDFALLPFVLPRERRLVQVTAAGLPLQRVSSASFLQMLTSALFSSSSSG